MSIFELVFILLAGSLLGGCLMAAYFGVTSQRVRAGHVLRRLTFGTTAYFALAVAASLIGRPRTFPMGDPQCFDDWCITVAGVEKAPWFAATVRQDSVVN